MLVTPSILLYSHPIENTGIYLQSLVETVVLRENIIIARHMDQLVKILRQPLNGVVAAIIFAKNEKELHELVALQDQLQRIPFILILPDQEQKIVTKAHSLRPRYLAYADSDLSDVRDVFKRMVCKANSVWH